MYKTWFVLFCLWFNAELTKAQHVGGLYHESFVSMGTRWQVTVYQEDSAKAIKDIQLMWLELQLMDSLWSNFRNDSEVTLIAARAGTDHWTEVHPYSQELYRHAIKICQASDGVLDITAAPLTKLWRRAFALNKWPEEADISTAKGSVGCEMISFSSNGQEIYLNKPGMALDLGGIAKGFAAQILVRNLANRGYPISLIDGGGDICMGQSPPHAKGWTVAIEKVNTEGEVYFDRHILQSTCIATSGNSFRYLDYDGSRYQHHILPTTGLPIKDVHRVTVISSSGLYSDALSTLLSLSPMIEVDFHEFEAYIITGNEKIEYLYRSNQ